jgi:hypothetical protein
MPIQPPQIHVLGRIDQLNFAAIFFAKNPIMRFNVYATLGICLLLVSGCGSVISDVQKKFAKQLTGGVLNHDDPATVRDGLPAYLLLLDGSIEGDPKNEDLLCAGANLYGAYAGQFVTEQARQLLLSKRSFGYASRAACAHDKNWCDIANLPLETIERELQRNDKDDLVMLNCLGAAWATQIQADSDNSDAIAQIPQLRSIFERIVVLDASYDKGSPYMYLGVLANLLPAAYGGQPEKSRGYFERAIALSDGHNLLAKTLYAEKYARAVFDQELHDRLLREVLAAPANSPGYTLSNTIAKVKAQALLASSKDYF